MERKASLQEIEICFRPEVWETSMYPWDRMDRINDKFSPLGLAITYNEPPISKEEWLKGEWAI